MNSIELNEALAPIQVAKQSVNADAGIDMFGMSPVKEVLLFSTLSC